MFAFEWSVQKAIILGIMYDITKLHTSRNSLQVQDRLMGYNLTEYEKFIDKF